MSIHRHSLPFRSYIYRLMLLPLFLSVSACRQESEVTTTPAAVQATVAGASTSSADAKPASIDTAAPAFLDVLSEGMPYARLREAVTGAGWLSLRNPMCWESVGGESRICNVLPEAESCSSDGACLMWFAAADGRRLRVMTSGPYRRWNDPAHESELIVSGWSLQQAAAAKPRPNCPGADFGMFLQRFVDDESVERDFTAPMVRVSELEDRGDDGYYAREVFVAGDTYRLFVLDGRPGAYSFEPDSGTTGTPKVSIETLSDDERLVRYALGSSEGNSFKFIRVGGCWLLTEDPEAPMGP